MMLGDTKGAFLSSGGLPQQYRPLYARLPAEGIPGVTPDALIDVIGHVYGLKDAPNAWQKTLHEALLVVVVVVIILQYFAYHDHGSSSAR